MLKGRWLVAVAASSVVAAATAVGFEAGRRYPFAILDELFDAEPPPKAAPWLRLADLPEPRYEASVAVVGKQIYVFGGFHERDILALDRVDVYDVTAGQWT